MTDLSFLRDLRAEFERLGPPGSAPRRGAIWRVSSAVTLGLSLLVVLGVAAAVLSAGRARRVPAHATTSRFGSPSEPLSGTIPGTVTPWRGSGPLSLAGYRYSITVTPSLDAGGAGWTSGISYIGPAFAPGSGGSSGGGGYPTRSTPVFAGSGITMFSSGAQRGEDVGYVLTGPQVAAVRFGNRTIATFTSPVLPAGDRAAVFFLPAGAPQPIAGWRPGATPSSFAGPARGQRVRTRWLLPLDDRGQPIPTTPVNQPMVWPSFWQAPSAVTPSIHEPPYHGPIHPGPGACELSQHGLPGLTPEWGHTIARIIPAPDALGATFLSCVDVEYYLHNWPLRAGVLLDGQQPGQVLGPIPGAQPVSGYPNTVDAESEHLTARRLGNAWLAILGGSGLTQRLEVLAALRLTKLSLPG